MKQRVKSGLLAVIPLPIESLDAAGAVAAIRAAPERRDQKPNTVQAVQRDAMLCGFANRFDALRPRVFSQFAGNNDSHCTDQIANRDVRLAIGCRKRTRSSL